jgi:hypothetical protein
MPIESKAALTAIERAAIEAEAASRNYEGTAEEFVEFYKWGQRDLEACVDAFVSAGTQSFVELGRALFVAVNSEPEKAAQLVPLIAEAKKILGLE